MLIGDYGSVTQLYNNSNVHSLRYFIQVIVITDRQVIVEQNDSITNDMTKIVSHYLNFI